MRMRSEIPTITPGILVEGLSLHSGFSQMKGISLAPCFPTNRSVHGDVTSATISIQITTLLLGGQRIRHVPVVHETPSRIIFNYIMTMMVSRHYTKAGRRHLNIQWQSLLRRDRVVRYCNNTYRQSCLSMLSRPSVSSFRSGGITWIIPPSIHVRKKCRNGFPTPPIFTSPGSVNRSKTIVQPSNTWLLPVDVCYGVIDFDLNEKTPRYILIRSTTRQVHF